MPERAARSILRRWAKAASMTPKTCARVAVVSGGGLRVIRTRPESTLGTGQNTFGGTVSLWRPDAGDWEEIPHTHSNDENSRGLGVADLANAIRSGRPHRANGDMAFHVLDAMQAFLESAKTGRHVELGSTCERPAPLPTGLRPGTLDE